MHALAPWGVEGLGLTLKGGQRLARKYPGGAFFAAAGRGEVSWLRLVAGFCDANACLPGWGLQT